MVLLKEWICGFVGGMDLWLMNVWSRLNVFFLVLGLMVVPLFLIESSCFFVFFCGVFFFCVDRKMNMEMI